MEDDVTVVAAGMATSVMAARVGTEDEAGEEDHRDDEHDAGDDADPRGDGAQPRVAPFLTRGPRFDGGVPGCSDYGFRAWFGWCFAHDSHIAASFDVKGMCDL
ncbi:hypothetical protein A5663_04345 [Mycobacterium sp. E740]|nr:hypothetical protein A5663_04345 [Mycobacterium sp. E740]